MGKIRVAAINAVGTEESGPVDCAGRLVMTRPVLIICCKWLVGQPETRASLFLASGETSWT